MSKYQRIVGRERLEFVGGGPERAPGDRGNFCGEKLGKARMRVEARADRGAALREREEAGHRGLDAAFSMLDLRSVAGKFLRERHRRRILQMRAPDLDDALERSDLLRQRSVKARERRQQDFVKFADGGDMHGGRKQIVRGLSEIDVIVGMNRGFLSARAAQPFRSPDWR